MSRKNLFYLSALIITVALPITLILVKHQQNNRSHAASPDQLEAEGGVLGGNAKIQTDSLASGGNYVLFGGFSITSGPISQSVTANSVEITWTLSENGTGQVEYGTTTSYGTLSTPENSFTYSTHIQTLSGLTAGTTYHYRVKSTNQAGAQVVSGDNAFTTSASGGTGAAGPRAAPADLASLVYPITVGAGAGDTPIQAVSWRPTSGTVRLTVNPGMSQQAIHAAMAAVPSGTDSNPSIIVFQPGTYVWNSGSFSSWVNQGSAYNFYNQSYVIAWGYGAIITTSQRNAAGFSINHNSVGTAHHIKLLGFTIAGDYALTGGMGDSFQGDNGIGIRIEGAAVSDIEIADCTTRNLYGYGIFLGGYEGIPPVIQYHSSRVSIHHNRVERTSQGLVIDQGTDNFVLWNYVKDTTAASIDIEDARAADQNFIRWYIRDNVFESWMWDGTSPFYPSGSITLLNNPADGSGMVGQDLYVERNTFLGGTRGYGDRPAGELVNPAYWKLPGDTYRCTRNRAIIAVSPPGWMGDGGINYSLPKTNVYIRGNRLSGIPADKQCGFGISVGTTNGLVISDNDMPGYSILTMFNTNENINQPGITVEHKWRTDGGTDPW